MTTSYSTFSIASLIGYQQVSADDATLNIGISGISAAVEATVTDQLAGDSDDGDAGENRLPVKQCETTTTALLHAHIEDSADIDASGGSLTGTISDMIMI